ncbi:DUF1152 domain-containing protein [Deinococcus aquatilis]|uniref:DUF1152 domain-containing protein n=1 Tax=Deinococcus aquatilis TaxID=519440 RepID=UPI001B7FA0B8|nr:DUF1152 domain-containing protein [Deinococcus aquatilis]
MQPPFFSAIKDSRRVLIAGMGGGFDVFCGLPLYFALRSEGMEVTLCNLSFTSFSPLAPHPLAPALTEVTPEFRVSEGAYFPEYYLSCWLGSQGEIPRVFALSKTGVQPLLAAYRALAEHLSLDTIILVDGGTDALMRGDEVDLGTPHEDAVSLCAVNELLHERPELKTYMVSLGFGIDHFHGVSHWNVLEATAELTRAGAYLGSFSLTPEQKPVQLYRAACEAVFRQMPRHVSIVNSSILSAVDGQYGDYHATGRTHGSELWINPLMAQYWCYELGPVARRLQYREALMDTLTMSEVDQVIRTHRESVNIRPHHALPL